MQIEILGNGHEVGRSAFLVSDRKNSVMLDYGVKIEPEPPQYPLRRRADAIILSHAHLDHSGGVPALYTKEKPHAFMTNVTLELSEMLLLDSLKVSASNGFNTPFTKKDINKLANCTKFVNYGEHFRVGNFACTMHDAGHIPGSAGTLMKNGKTIFFTGDIQTTDSNLLRGCRLPPKTDVLITESTYSYKNHPLREIEEDSLRQHVEEALARDEKVLLPVFATGRSQEVLLILEKYANKIALDGMAKKASDIIAQYPGYLKDKKRLKGILKRIHWVHGHESRLKAAQHYPIVIATAGMLGGGPATHYLKEMKHRQESKILFTGFLVEDSPGSKLLETKIFKNAEEQFKVHCEMWQFELSAHTDKNGLMSIIKKLNPETIICVHGEKTAEFAKDIEKHFPSVQAYAPKNGDVIRI